VFTDTTGTAVHTDKQAYETYDVLSTMLDSTVYYTDLAEIAGFNATKLEYSDGVLLTWTLTDGNVGLYKVETRPAGTTGEWTVLADSLSGSWYKDTKANPFVSEEWEYQLTMTYECNGNVMSTSSKPVVGSRNP
jgi:hypothetical protein